MTFSLSSERNDQSRRAWLSLLCREAATQVGSKLDQRKDEKKVVVLKPSWQTAEKKVYKQTAGKVRTKSVARIIRYEIQYCKSCLLGRSI
jgi:hypothetical protein